MQPSASEHLRGERDRGALTYVLPKTVDIDRDVHVKMRDGIELAVTVYRPELKGRFPVVMCVTVYGKDRGPDEYSTLPRIKKGGGAVGNLYISDVTPWEGPDPGFWVPNGYVVVVANARGYYNSDGQAGVYSEKDAEDYHDLIEWAGVQEWSSGAVGLNGVSYLAISQWMTVSRTRPSHLKAMIPWEGASDLLRDVVRPGGVPETRFLKGYYAGSLAQGGGENIVTQGPAMMEKAARHPLPLENIDIPALICASWSDHGLHTRGSIEGFMRITSTQKWLYTHGRNKWEVYYSPEALAWQRSFFDRFLKEEDNGFEQRRRIRLEVRWNTEDYEARNEDAWPLDRTRFTPLFLDLDRSTLSPHAPLQPQSRDYDAQSGQTVEFNLAFDRRTEVTGSMMLKLWVAALDTDDLDLFLAVRKFDNSGREVHFCGKDGYRKGVVALGWLRVSQRHLDPERTKPWRPYYSFDRTEKVQPGEITPVEVEILPSSTRFEAGESLRLVLSGRDIVQTERFGHDDTINRGRHRLHAGGAHPAHLLVPFC